MARVIHISESHHWYADGGAPVFEVPSKDGKNKIEPTLREARVFGLLPGCTGINKQLSNPFLETWKQENALRFAYANKPNDGESQDEYVRRVAWLADGVGRDAADAGKVIHKDVEDFFAETIYPVSSASQRAVDTISDWCRREGYVKFTPEVSFGSRDKGYGGRVDLRAERENGEVAVLDFKTCDIAKIRQPYESWGWQLAAYKRGLDLHPSSRLVSVPIDRGTGEVKFMEWSPDDQVRSLMVFQHTFEIWCMRRNYDPRKWVDVK